LEGTAAIVGPPAVAATGPAVEVLDVSAATPSLVETLAEPLTSTPDDAAVLPGTFLRVYVTLPGTQQFDVIDNTSTPPAQVTGAPFNLVEQFNGLQTAAAGVAIPVFNASAFAYFTTPAFSTVQPYQDETPPTPPAQQNSIVLTGGSLPHRVATVPIPQ
jgi:hypothetical protein